MTTTSNPAGGKAGQPVQATAGQQGTAHATSTPAQPSGATPAAQAAPNRPFQTETGLAAGQPPKAQPAAEPLRAVPQPAPQPAPNPAPQPAAAANPTPAPAQPAATPAAQPVAQPVAKPAPPPAPVAQAQPIAVKPMTTAVAQPAARPVPAAPVPPPTEPVRPTVSVAHPRGRHWLLLLSFLLMVVLPTAVWAWYLWARASDQYVSTVGFSVRREDTPPAIDLLGGFAPLAGGSGASDTDILYEYIRSQDMVETINSQLDLRARFSRDWPKDFIFALNPEDHIEDMTDYWQSQVKVLYDTSSSLITLRVSAFTPEDAQEIAAAVFQQSSDKINELSAVARDDATRLAKAELDQSRQELTTTRQAMTAFRMKSQIVDPTADLAGQMGVLSGLQGQLAEALIAHDLLTENTRPNDNRITQSQQKIDALRRLIDAERGKFGAEGQGPDGESYAQLMAEYEKLAVDREFAEGAYRGARIAYEAALAEAQRKSRYLAAHIEPKVAQSSTEPDRPWLLVMVTAMLMAGWSILALIYYSVRDRR